MVCELDADARMTIVMRFISGALQNLILLVLKLGKHGRHCTDECTTCQAIRRRGTWKSAIEDSNVLSCRLPSSAALGDDAMRFRVSFLSNAARSRPVARSVAPRH
jgi:hypothetical protein